MTYVSWVSDRMTYAIDRVFDMAYQHHREAAIQQGLSQSGRIALSLEDEPTC